MRKILFTIIIQLGLFNHTIFANSYISLDLVEITEYSITQDNDYDIGSIQNQSSTFTPYDSNENKLTIGNEYWGRLILKNKGTTNQDLLLYVGEYFNPLVEVYIIEDGSITLKKDGYFLKQNEKDVKEGQSTKVSIMIKGNDEMVVYFKTKKLAHALPSLRLKLETINTFTHFIKRRNIIQGLFQGAFWILVLFNLLIFVISKDKINLFYSLYMAGGAIYYLFYLGYTQEIFFQELPKVNPFIWILSSMATIFYLSFSRKFLETKELNPKLDKVLMILIGTKLTFGTVSLISLFFADHFMILELPNVLMIMIEFLFMLTLFVFLRKRLGKLVGLFLGGTSCLIVGAIISQYILLVHGDGDGIYIMEAGQLGEALLFALGIGYRMILINKEKQKAQEQLIDQLQINEKIQEENKVQLEKTVDERTEQLRIKNNHNETLLGEIHHRVKNNLQTITSLLSIQQRKLKDPESIKVIHDSKNRVIAMGLIHEHLYQNTSFDEIDFKRYVKELIDSLITTYSTSEKNIEVSISIPDIKVDLDNGIFLGLIINELVNNSIKHAYDGVEKPFLEILISDSKEQMILVVNDNGKTKDVNYNSPKSFGWKMVNTLCQKLNGILEVDNSDGLSVQICFSPSLAISDQERRS